MLCESSTTDERQRKPDRRGPLRRGATSIEFAICAPLIFLFTFGGLEFSRVNMIRQSVENAVYEGCRRGIVPGATASDVRDAAQAVLDSVMVSDAQITIVPAVIDEDATDITVSVVIPIGSNSWVMPVYFEGKNVSSSMTLRRERGLNSVN